MQELPSDRSRWARWRADIGALAFLAAAVTLLFRDVVFTSQVFFYHDHLFGFRPLRMLAERMREEGGIPTWSRDMYFGQSWGGGWLTYMVYPTSLLYRFLSFEAAFKTHILLHYYLAAFGAYALARSSLIARPGLRPVAAAVGGISYALGSFLVSFIHFAIPIITTAWSPWIVLALGAATRRPSVSRLVMASVVVALALLGTEAQMLFYSLVVAGVVALANAERGTGGTSIGWRVFRTAWVFVVVGVVAASLAGALVLPTLETISLSPRGEGLAEDERSHFHLSALTTLEMFIPRALGNPTQDIYYLGARVWGTACVPQAPYFLSIYVGLVAVCLSACGTLLRRGVLPRVMGAIAAIAIVLMYGTSTPLFDAVNKALPFLKAFRFPVKYFALFSMLHSLLIAMGTDTLLRQSWGELTRRQRWVCGTLCVVALGGAWAGVAVWALESGDAQHLYEDAVSAGLVLTLDEPALTMCKGVLDRAVDSTGITALLQLAMLTAAAWTLSGRRRMVAAWGLAILFAVDLTRANQGILRIARQEMVDTMPPVVKALPADARPCRIVSRLTREEYLRPEELLTQRKELLSKVEQTECDINGLHPMTGLQWGLSYGNFYDPGSFTSRRMHDVAHALIRRGGDSRWVNSYVRTGVRFVISLEPIKDARMKLLETVQNGTNHPYLLYEVLGTLPRALLVATPVAAGDDKGAIERWLSPEFDPRRELLLETAPSSDAPTDPIEGGVEWLTDRSAEVDLRVTSALPQAWLLLLDSWWPGWEATVDGERVPIERADVLFRAVKVSQGVHRVRFHYESKWGRIGIWVSVCAAALCLLAVLCSLLRFLQRR